jgi:hypothetical protein
MRLKASKTVFPTILLFLILSGATRAEEKYTPQDSSRQVIVNNYYYGAYGYSPYPYYPPYPIYYGYYYPRLLVAFSLGRPFFHHPGFHPRFHHFRGHGFGRSFGQFRSPGATSRFGRGRYYA